MTSAIRFRFEELEQLDPGERVTLRGDHQHAALGEGRGELVDRRVEGQGGETGALFPPARAAHTRSRRGRGRQAPDARSGRPSAGPSIRTCRRRTRGAPAGAARAPPARALRATPRRPSSMRGMEHPAMGSTFEGGEQQRRQAVGEASTRGAARGRRESSGRYAPPAFQMPSTAAISSGERSIATATSVLHAHAVREEEPGETARPGVELAVGDHAPRRSGSPRPQATRLAWRVKRSTSETNGRSRAALYPARPLCSSRMRRRSTGDRRGARSNRGPSGCAAPCSSNESHWSRTRSMPGAEKRSVAYSKPTSSPSPRGPRVYREVVGGLLGIDPAQARRRRRSGRGAARGPGWGENATWTRGWREGVHASTPSFSTSRAKRDLLATERGGPTGSAPGRRGRGNVVSGRARRAARGGSSRAPARPRCRGGSRPAYGRPSTRSRSPESRARSAKSPAKRTALSVAPNLAR